MGGYAEGGASETLRFMLPAQKAQFQQFYQFYERVRYTQILKTPWERHLYIAPLAIFLDVFASVVHLLQSGASTTIKDKSGTHLLM